jgi:hypothetical protein
MANGYPPGQVPPTSWEDVINVLSPMPGITQIVDTLLPVLNKQRLEVLVSLPATPPDWLRELFTKAQSEAWLEQFLLRLRPRVVSPRLRDAIDRALGIGAAAARPPWYDSHLPMGKPFINHDSLRDTLFRFFEREDFQLLKIRGSNPGKTYCRWLLRHLAGTNGMQVIYVDAPSLHTVHDFAVFLVDSLGLAYREMSTRFGSEVNDGVLFNTWLQGRLRKIGAGGARRMLIFDHLAKPGVHQAVQETVVGLAKHALNRDLTNTWVVVLDCGPIEVLDDPGSAFEEVVPPLSRADVDDLMQWLTQVWNAAGEEVPQPPQELLDMLDRLGPSIGKEDLASLERKLAGWCHSRRN